MAVIIIRKMLNKLEKLTRNFSKTTLCMRTSFTYLYKIHACYNKCLNGGPNSTTLALI